jgi:hypothetical protein
MTGYFFIADLLGFGSVVRNSTDSELVTRINSWTGLVESLAKKNAIENIQLISDTIFASTDSSSEGLKKLILFSRALLNDGVPQSFAIRGAIVHGEYNWGRLTYGKAVIAAHELETNQNWIGVSCEEGLPHMDDHWGFESLLAYPTPQKNGPIMIRPVVDWDIPSTKELTSFLCRGGLTRAGEIIPWTLGEKLNNTMLFSIYKALIRKNHGSANKFHGLSAMEVIELHVAQKLLY